MGFNFVGPGASNPTEVAQSCSWGSWGGWRSLLSFPSASTARGAAFQAGGRGGSRQAPCPHGQEERRPLGTVGLGRVASVPGELPWIRSCQAGGIALGREVSFSLLFHFKKHSAGVPQAPWTSTRDWRDGVCIPTPFP